jgi:predicted PolB exonuclease-like 3'-5' exonuclease
MQFLILDIETIVDPGVWTPPATPEAWALTAESSGWNDIGEREQQPAWAIEGTVQPPTGDPFPPPFACRPICIGAVLLESTANTGVMKVKKVGVIEDMAPGLDAAAIELSVLQQFSAYVGRKAPGAQTVVTWNGRRFDLPVLVLRSMRYGIPNPWYFANRDVRYRYTEDGHCDLADAISDYGSAPAPKLDGMAKLIGLPGKFGDIEGAKVGEAFAAGRLKDIGSYCLSDAVQTAFIWLRWLALKGHIEPDAYRQSAAELLGACAGSDRLKGFMAQVDRRVLLLEEARAA